MKIRNAATNIYLKHFRTGHNDKISRFLKRVDRGYLFVRRSLETVYPSLVKPDITQITIALTANCNSRCDGCQYGRTFMSKNRLSLQTVKALLQDARDLNVPRVHFFGGEPLLHPNIYDIVAYAKALGLNFSLGTNGILLSREKMNRLYELGLRSIQMGVYGFGPGYDQYVGREGSFERLKENIIYARTTYPDVRVSLAWLLMRETADLEVLGQFWEFAQKHHTPFGLSLFNYDHPYFDNGQNRDYQLYAEDKPLVDKVVETMQEYLRKRPDLVNHTPVGLKAIPDWIIQKEKMRVPCHRYGLIWVGPNGVVRVCVKLADLGNLNKSSFKDIVYTDLHTKSARNCVSLNCTNCTCSFDTRTYQYVNQMKLGIKPKNAQELEGVLEFQ